MTAARRAIGALATALLMVACTSASPTSDPTNSPGLVTPSPTVEGTAGTPTPPAPTPDPLPTGPDRLRLEPVADGLVEPIGITSAGDGSGRLFVNERGGRIRVIGPGGNLRADPFVDLSNRLVAGAERGLLGVTFHPDFETNRRLFVHYSRAGDGATVVSELRATADLASADPGSERILLTVTQPFANHNGGQIAFGPDGYLYIGLGDGGSGGDPLGNGQNPNVLLGKILRIDVDGEPQGRRAYALPPDNPYGVDGADPGAGLPEIWALGLRNPWRFSFDPEGGDLYIGDVGQRGYEEIDRQPGDSDGGENYGWNVMEGRHCYTGDCDQTGFVKPIAEYRHELGCSVTGGYVYRGSAQPELHGTYVFADYCSGFLFTLQVDAGTVTPKLVLESGLSVSSFGTDEDGEIYVADLSGGGIHHVLVDD
ncbi:MAG TPA: PQQ-dependent sugar dehydrogenase [Candidatus Limnocylindria bacterium]|nr:PQQ-dependent sugar dehydrogenase [Candidatus Limnocylindria bacterium]